MMPPEKLLPVLYLVERNVLEFFRANPGINNYTVMRAYDAANDHFRALSRGMTPKNTLAGVEATLFERVLDACQKGIEGGIDFDKKRSEPLVVEEIRSALGKLRKSVDFWHQQGGRTGYLDYIQSQVH